VHTYEHDEAGEGVVVHTAFSRADAAYVREHRDFCNLKLTIGDVDLPAYVSNGIVYVQAPFGYLCETFAAHISAIIRDLETRVSGEGSAALSLSRNGCSIHGATMVVARVVRGGRQS